MLLFFCCYCEWEEEKKQHLIFLWTIWNTTKREFQQKKQALDLRNLKYRKKAFFRSSWKECFFGKAVFFRYSCFLSFFFRLQHTFNSIKSTSNCGYILDIGLGPLSRRNVKKHFFYVHVRSEASEREKKRRNGTKVYCQGISFLKKREISFHLAVATHFPSKWSLRHSSWKQQNLQRNFEFFKDLTWRLLRRMGRWRCCWQKKRNQR
jgi:hypothetical protein